MACSAQSMTIESYPEASSSSYATPSEETELLRDRRRRHSFHTARKLSCDYDADAVFLRVSSPPGWYTPPNTPPDPMSYRSNSSSRRWKGACTGSRNIAALIWSRSTRVYGADMQHSRPFGTLVPMPPGNLWAVARSEPRSPHMSSDDDSSPLMNLDPSLLRLTSLALLCRSLAHTKRCQNRFERSSSRNKSKTCNARRR